MLRKKKKTSSVKALETALVRILVDTPVSDITIQRLCDEANINRSTFYLHFHDLGELIKFIESDIKENISFHLATKDGLETKLVSLMEYIKERSLFFRVFLDPKNHGEIKLFLDDHVLEAIETEFDLGEDPITRKYLRVFIISGLCFMTFEWILANCDLTPNNLTELMMRFIENGVKS